MRKVMVLNFSIVFIVAIAVLSCGGETKDVGVPKGADTKDITVLGITLGKSLREAGIPECKYKKIVTREFTAKGYDYTDHDCYRDVEMTSNNPFCSTEVDKLLSFRVTISLSLLEDCDRQSPVQQIIVTFNSNDYSKMMQLMKDKFGSPDNTETSSVQNKMGATFTKLRDSWMVKGCDIYMTNIGSKVDEGVLLIRHPDRLRQTSEESRLKRESDRNKF